MQVAPQWAMYRDWRALLASGLSDAEQHTLERHERTGRPLGDSRFLRRLKASLGRVLHPQKPGPKRRRWEELSMVSPEFPAPPLFAAEAGEVTLCLPLLQFEKQFACFAN